MTDERGNHGSRVKQGLSGAEFAGIGFQFALTILVFVFGGVWLDKRLGTSPWFVLVGVVAGAGGGFYSMYLKAVRASKGGSPAAGGPERDSERQS